MKNTTRLFAVIAISLYTITSNTCFAQNKTSAVNSTGGHFTTSTIQLDFSVGEVAIKPLSTATNLVTVGVLQPSFAGVPGLMAFNFTGYINEANQAGLNWAMPQEINNNHFEVERSADGLAFAKIVAVAGNDSAFGHTYKAVDPAPFSGITYYRVKQVGNNGDYSYSNTIALVTNDLGNRFVVSPNPFNYSIKVRALAQKPYAIKIFSMDGRQVAEKTFTGDETSVDLATLAKGMYLLKLFSKDGSYIQSVKITKQ